MKPRLLLLALLAQATLSAQSLDYLSIRKKNGQVVKNFYTGSPILLQLTDNSYLQGPIKAIRNDTLFLTVYDVRLYPTAWGSVMRDTIAVTVVPIRRNEIKRVQLRRRQTLAGRFLGPLAFLGGSTYLALNTLNGTFFSNQVSGADKRRTALIGAGLAAVGYTLIRLFRTDGFSKKTHRIEYVDL